MALPFFFKEALTASAQQLILDEETSRHVAQVLRMQNGEQLQLTDGKGNLFTAEITDNHKKKCVVKILTKGFHTASPKKITIAISLVKNAHRFEWFLEKATEIGVSAIIPLLCSRTEKQHFRAERMKDILISAMLQSQQVWLPELPEPVRYAQYIKSLKEKNTLKKFIAHCREDEPRKELFKQQERGAGACLILIGPEGDFTIEEIEQALENNFVPVALGSTRLRTETAGLVAATILGLS